MGKQQNILQKAVLKTVTPLQKFMHIEASSGVILLVATALALFAANSIPDNWYDNFVNMALTVGVGTSVLNKSLLLFVNDGLMAIFFFVVGLEIKREILVGELSSAKKAAFSIFAAIGGMAVPALVYIIINSDSGQSQGWGVPMATDIAFAIGILALLGKRVPTPLKIFLLALAIVDDLGAILVIALFYTSEVSTGYLGVAGIALFLLFLLNHAGVRNIGWGIGLGLITWFCFLKSGVHATIAGVLLAFLTPARKTDSKDSELLLDTYIHALHPWVAFGIMPIFAFFNAGVFFGGINFSEVIVHPVSLGIILGLLVGKTTGIFGFTYLAVKFKLAELPKGCSWPHVVGVSLLAAIGFTMSLFISSLAFTDPNVLAYSKIGILVGSTIAMVLGLAVLWLTLPKKAS